MQSGWCMGRRQSCCAAVSASRCWLALGWSNGGEAGAHDDAAKAGGGGWTASSVVPWRRRSCFIEQGAQQSGFS